MNAIFSVFVGCKTKGIHRQRDPHFVKIFDGGICIYSEPWYSRMDETLTKSVWESIFEQPRKVRVFYAVS